MKAIIQKANNNLNKSEEQNRRSVHQHESIALVSRNDSKHDDGLEMEDTGRDEQQEQSNKSTPGYIMSMANAMATGAGERHRETPRQEPNNYQPGGPGQEQRALSSPPYRQATASPHDGRGKPLPHDATPTEAPAPNPREGQTAGESSTSLQTSISATVSHHAEGNAHLTPLSRSRSGSSPSLSSTGSMEHDVQPARGKKSGRRGPRGRGIHHPGGYSSLPASHGTEQGSNLPSKMNIVANLAYVRKTQEVVSLRHLSTGGPAWTKILGMIAGGTVTGHECYGLAATFSFFSSSPPPSPTLLLLLVLHQGLCLLLGFSLLLLECRSVFCSTFLHKKTREYFKFLSYLWGRGLLYLVTGALLALRFLSTPTASPPASSLLFSPPSSSSSSPPLPSPTYLDSFLSLYLALLGALLLLLSLHYARRLSSTSHPPTLLPHHTTTDPLLLLRAKFDRADIYSQGKIPSTDLAMICAELGSRLSHQELETAILTLDANRHGEVEYDDFVEWWQGR
ncbi:calmodulin like myosin light chain [Nannochloropsis gaditana]|uniref:Calmodulin like myosin light chain n=1 Tax=Nannochloropsis gaditana TaxID=72520 RepID=W7T9Y6_9STRA|nr:calmodulin like myosin light chain [Nannochloropsis gaditana]